MGVVNILDCGSGFTVNAIVEIHRIVHFKWIQFDLCEIKEWMLNQESEDGRKKR